jgi:hypothetical protein
MARCHTKKAASKFAGGFFVIVELNPLRATAVASGLFFGRAGGPSTHESKKGGMKMPKEYSPHATAYAVRCNPDTLRDWRRMGFFKNLGERKGKGHLFTPSDVARIAVASFIGRSGASLRSAFEIVDERGPLIDSVVGAERGALDTRKDYFLTFVIDPDASFPASVTSAPAAKIEFDSEPVGILQVNVSSLVRSVLNRLDSFEDSVVRVA